MMRYLQNVCQLPAHRQPHRRRLLLFAIALVVAGLVALLPMACYAEGPQAQVHIVMWGETLSSIALRYGVTLDSLMQANGITNSHYIRAGDQLIIPPPGEPAKSGEPPANAPGGQGEQKTHTVAYGESLYAIALFYGVDMRDLAAANGIANPDIIRPGQRLIIPSGSGQAGSGNSGAAPSTGSSPQPANAVYHVVRYGDTLYGIALEYGVSADAIASANGLTNPSLIFAGQRLLISGSVQGGNPQPTPTPAPSGQQPQAQPTLPAKLGYGVCVHLLNQDMDAVLNAVQGLGFTWVKQQIEWKLFEPAKGQIQWAMLDQVVNAANNHGLHLVLSVVKAPKWARPADSDLSVDGPPANPADYAAFVGALAARYQGKVAAYEVWNEQNLWYEWGGKGHLSAAEYVKLLQAAHDSIKAADPGAIVISGGLTPTGVNDGYTAFDDVNYLGQMYAAGARPYFDVLGAHPSGYNNPPDDSPEHNSTNTSQFKGHWSFYFRRFEQLHDVMLLNGDGGKQMWLTEFGWSSQSNPPAGYEYAADNTAEQQATYLVRAFQILKDKGYVGAAFVWNLNYAPVCGPADEKAGFSLMGADGRARPAYAALAAMAK